MREMAARMAKIAKEQKGLDIQYAEAFRRIKLHIPPTPKDEAPNEIARVIPDFPNERLRDGSCLIHCCFGARHFFSEGVDALGPSTPSLRGDMGHPEFF